jgi:hypothetical protein
MACVFPQDSHTESTVPNWPVRQAAIASRTFLCSVGIAAPNHSR